MFRKSGAVIFILLAATLIAGCSSGFVPAGEKAATAAPPSIPTADSPTNGLVQSNNGGQVTIDVEWIGLDGDRLIFTVAMNTHSVDLDSYDLGELAVLRDDEGAEYQPVSWDSPPGGHHRQGELSFSPPASLSRGMTTYLEIVIRDVAGVGERVMKWEL